MLVQLKHLQWDAEKYEKNRKEVEESVRNGELSRENAGYLLSRKQCGPFIRVPGDRCFACSGDLGVPAVIWHGSHPTKEEALEVWFHPECVELFTQQLMRDVHEAEHGKEAADAMLKAAKAASIENAKRAKVKRRGRRLSIRLSSRVSRGFHEMRITALNLL